MSPDTLRKDNPGLVVARVLPGFLSWMVGCSFFQGSQKGLLS